MTDYSSFDDHQVKHMEMIQAVISRLGNDSFLVKGWTVTVLAAFLGFAVTQDKWELALASLGPTLLFWILDATYLRSERLFRHLYERVRRGTAGIEPFFMGATSPDYRRQVAKEATELKAQNDASLWQTWRREALSIFYGAVLLAALLASAIICRT